MAVDSRVMICRYKPGQEVTGKAEDAQVLAGRFVSVTGEKSDQGDYVIAHTAAGEPAFGVAEYASADPTADGVRDTDADLRVNVVRRGAIARVEAGGALAAGDLVAAGADGVAVEAAEGDAILGVCVSGGGEGDAVEVDLILTAPTVGA